MRFTAYAVIRVGVKVPRKLQLDAPGGKKRLKMHSTSGVVRKAARLLEQELKN
jgi:hypothetical protein